jgi:hypothetical protein
MPPDPSPPPRLSGRHRDTLRHVLARPSSRNVEWHAVVAMLREVGKVEERGAGVIEVTANGRTLMLPRPHGKDVSTDDLVELRRFLEGLGYRDDA